MDGKKRLTPLMPAYLWIGQKTSAAQEAMLFLKEHLCVQRGCDVCYTCKGIDAHDHHAILWLAPKKQYTLEELEPLFQTITFARTQDAPYFFVIEKADQLSVLCANKLLKRLEEPPSGYHFILLAEQKEAVLPTIRSRCIIQTYQQKADGAYSHRLLAYMTQQMDGGAAFLQELEQSKINEQETVQLCNQVLLFWQDKVKNMLLTGDEQGYQIAGCVFDVVCTAMHMLPMPGSSKIFLKDLFLRVQSVIRDVGRINRS